MKSKLRPTLGGDKYWELPNGKLHREDGPAIEWSDGTKVWFLNGIRHREDGPAIERYNGTKEWCLNGTRHREDGPAIVNVDGDKEWWLWGRKLTENQVSILQDESIDLDTRLGILRIELGIDDDDG